MGVKPHKAKGLYWCLVCYRHIFPGELYGWMHTKGIRGAYRKHRVHWECLERAEAESMREEAGAEGEGGQL